MRVAVVGVVASGLLLAACSAPAPTPTPSPSVVPLRAVAACGAGVVVPADTVTVTPDADAPPTVVLRVGGAVTFPVASGYRVGVAGDADADADAQLCAAPTDDGGVEYVALSPGYLRIGIQRGVESPLRVLIKVTS